MGDIEQFILNKLEKLDEKLDGLRDDNIHTKTALEAQKEQGSNLKKELEEVNSSMYKQGARLDEYNSQLAVHIKRTEMLERDFSKLEEDIHPVLQEYMTEKTVDKWISDKWAKRMKVVGYIGVMLGIIATIVTLLRS